MYQSFEIEWRTLYYTLSTNIAFFMVGYAFAFPSPIAREVKSGNLLDDYQFGIFSGIFYLAAAVSGLCAIPMVSLLGRKPVIMSAAFVSAAGWLLLGSSRIPELLICARVITGLGSGLSTPIVPIYVAELANKKTRGRHLCVTGFALSFGVLVIFLLGIKLSYSWLAAIGSVICILESILIFPAPYTPAYLVSTGLEKQALITLKSIRSKSYDALSEIYELREIVKNQQMNVVSRLSLLSEPCNLKALVIVVLLMITHQSTGINLLSSFSSELLSNNQIDSNILAMVFPISNIIGSILNLLLVDRIGRKILLLISYINITIALLLLAIYLLLIDVTCPYVIQNIHLNNYTITAVCVSPYLLVLPLFCFILFCTVFTLGIGNIGYMLLGELIPLQMKQMVSGIGTFSLFMTSFILVTLYPIITHSIPRSYFILCLSCIFMILCVVTFILTPETKGKSTAELEDNFKGNTFFIINN